MNGRLDQVRRRYEAAFEDRPRWHADVAIIGGTLLLFYVVFTLFGLALGFDLNGIVSTLRQVTFFAAVYALVVLALNLHWGYTGLFNIGVAGFMAIGVYTMAILTAPEGTGFGLPLWVGIVGGLLASAIIGFLVALPALRLRADYFAIVTLGFSEMIRLALTSASLREFELLGYETGTGGGSGIRVTGPDVLIEYLLYEGGDRRNPPNELGDVLFSVGNAAGIRESVVLDWVYVLFLVLFVVGFYLLLTRIAYSPFGRVLKAIREDELAARSLGKDTTRMKIVAFVLGCALMGLAGMLWQGSRVLVTPQAFMPIVTFYVFVALIIGGSGSNAGSIVGAVVFAGALWEGPPFVQRIIRDNVDAPSPPTIYDAVVALGDLNVLPLVGYVETNMDQIRFMLFGLVLILLMLYRPRGLLGHRKETAAAVDLSDRGGETDD